jgi:hypothetical protein
MPLLFDILDRFSCFLHNESAEILPISILQSFSAENLTMLFAQKNTMSSSVLQIAMICPYVKVDVTAAVVMV